MTMANTGSSDKDLKEDVMRLLITIMVTGVVTGLIVLIEQKTNFIIKLFGLGL